MIVIVGHGPSAYGKDIDEHTVVRCATAGWDKPGRGIPYPGTRTDILCSRLEKYQPDWLIQGELEDYCKQVYPRRKASTGLCACILARRFYPDEDIRVIGFDWVLNPELAEHKMHDWAAENACFKTLGILPYE